MPVLRDARKVLDQEMLEIRARLLELGAALDRVERCGPEAGDDPRWNQIRQALEALASERTARTENIQLLFSLPYDPQWRQRLSPG